MSGTSVTAAAAATTLFSRPRWLALWLQGGNGYGVTGEGKDRAFLQAIGAFFYR